MQNSKKIIFLTAALSLLVGGAFYFGQSSKKNPPSLAEETAVKVKNIKPSEEIPEKFEQVEVSAKSEKLSDFQNFTVNEKKSLLVLSTLLSAGAKDDLPMNELVNELKDLKLVPQVMKEENEHTGTLNVVRTKEALPGTRYLHAQYFEGEGTTSLLQHLSFEFKGGDGAFEMVKKVIKEQFKITSSPTRETDTYIQWRVGRRIVWVKQLDLADISKPNPFNSYDLKFDVGTIRVTIELEIH